MAIQGKERKFYVGAYSGGNYTWLAGEQSNSFNMDAEAIEVTDKSSEWKQFIAGMKGATAEVTVFTDHSDSQQSDLLSSLMSGSTVACFIGEGNVSNGFVFEALVTSVGETNDIGSVSSRSISLQVTGEVETVS